MLPDEAANAAVLRNCFEGAVGGLVSRRGTLDGDVVDVGDSVLGNLQLKDVCHIVVGDGNHISPTHREFGEMEGAVWRLESCVVAGSFGESAFVVSDIQVEHSSAGMTCELLGDLFGEGSDTGMLDCYGIEWFETGQDKWCWLLSSLCRTSRNGTRSSSAHIHRCPSLSE